MVVALCGGVAGAQENLDAINTRVVELYGKRDYACATKVAGQALRIAERQLGKDAVETAMILNNLAGLEAALGRFPDAARLFDRARNSTRRHVARVLTRSRPAWLANGKAVAQEATSQQIILSGQSTNPATQAAAAALEKVRADRRG